MGDATLPIGEYAIVEILGHRTIVGRVTEVERFGSKLMSIEPVFRGALLDAVLISGGSIYQFTPCSPEAALKRAPEEDWHLPSPIRDALPAILLAVPETEPPAFLSNATKELRPRCIECGLTPIDCNCCPF